MTGLAGGCQCGAVRYRLEAPLSEPHLCHCRMCQKAAGNYFMPLAGVAKSAFRLTRGEPAWFHSSEPVRRGFCAACGTPLVYDAVDSAHLAVTLGSLDEPWAVEPVIQYGVEARMPWFADLARLREARTPEVDAEDGVEAGRVADSCRQHPDHDTETWPSRRQE